MSDKKKADKKPDKKPDKNQKTKETPKAAKKSEEVRLPLLLELTFNLSGLVLLVAAVLVSGLSFLNGASLIDIAIRTAVTVLVLGVLLTTVARMLASGLVRAATEPDEDSGSLNSFPPQNA